MPFAPKLKDEKDMQAQAGGQNISGVSASFNVPGQNAGAATKGAKSSGQYQNLQKYLSANQEQGAQMGQQVAGQVEQKAIGGQEALKGLQSQVQKTGAYDPNAAIQKAQSGQLSEQEKQAYKTTKQTGGYTGAQDVSGLAGYGEAQKQFGQATEAVNQLGSESGQQQLLKSTFQRPNYSQGANKLDQVLLGQSVGGKKAMEDLSQKYSTLGKQFSDDISQAQKDIEASIGQALKNKSAFAPLEEKAMSDLINPIQERVDKANVENPALVKRIEEDLADEWLSQETLNELGLSGNQRIFDIDLSKYLKKDLTQQNLNTMATDPERQKYSALSSLFDQAGDQISAQNPMAGYDPLSFDLSAFQAEQAAKQKDFEDFARGKTYSVDTGYDHGSLLGARGSANLWDLTQGQGPSIINSYSDYFEGEPIEGIEAQNAASRQAVIDNIMAQMRADLEAQKYNRIINPASQGTTSIGSGKSRITGGLK